MTRFNLSDWAVRHRTLVLFFMIICLVGGVLSFFNLGRQEDPDFAIQTMVVQTVWPGATTGDTMLQVTDRIEKKLQETPNLDFIRSFTKPGVSVVFVNLRESVDAEDIPWIWYEVRKKVSDIAQTLPDGVRGPFFNDEFGDVFGNVYGLTVDGFSQREARDFAETARSSFLRVADVGKVELFGAQDEKIYLSFSPAKLAALGLNFNQVLAAIGDQNAVAPAGVISTRQENILVEVSGAIESERGIEAINLFVNGRFYPLTELATITRGYADPPSKMFRVNGKAAIGIAVSMRSGGNNLTFGEGLNKAAAQLQQQFPIGADIVLVSDQPQVVSQAIGGFTRALFEAIAIVLAVSFLSLGLRAGLVVALSIPLVLSIVFLGMEMLGISLQRVSLGALIIALGLLVDDAMITIEMMVSKIEEGMEKLKAATFAYISTAFPMLTGTLVTLFGFLPVGFADSMVGQYCFSLFAVMTLALLSSWFVAVIFAPVIGVTVLPSQLTKKKDSGFVARFRGSFHRVLVGCMRHRYLTIAVTLALFVAALFAQQFVQRQFFPASDRPELLVTLTLPKNASIFATAEQVDAVEKLIEGDADIERYSSTIGGGAVRFYLPLDVQLDNDFLAQFVIVTKGLEERDRLRAKLENAFATGFDNVLARVSPLELGPPVGWPVQYRVSASTPDEARDIAGRVADALRASNAARTVNLDWSEKNKTVRLIVNQDRVRQLGLSSLALSELLYTVFNGAPVTEIRDSIYLVDVLARAGDEDRLSLDTLRNMQVNLPTGGAVPLAEIASLSYTLDDGYIWRRDRLPTITVQADTAPGLEAPTVYQRLAAQIDEIGGSLPPGAAIVEGGTVEKSASSNASLLAKVPLMVMLMLIVLMIQLQSFSRLFLVISVAPLGVIGVVVALLLTGSPLGFVAILGLIALVGMIIRNSVILVDQIEHNRAAGADPWTAVVEAALHRLRPILLTAAAAILGMVPIMRDVFWGPMAFTIVGGLAFATVLTLLFLPALYVAWFRVEEPESDVPRKSPSEGGSLALETGN
ncbi:efflux RND transporter permease subunit [Aquamicrobium sp. LC103]|uniref:efflux RND transporter permease subunit n=1 Tax=Aquamicrobium sp. LC103 TaxID=1120658 RepID=UPI00063EBBB7|nr:efflux RND transporter permease subunit [Aquamicrobium sp. LC103]TKT69665.1 efflux RND transporter permease subunit [Aquamicrobium sp. LC103]